MFNKKEKNLIVENAKLQVKLEFVLQQNTYLKNKVDELHKALLSRVAPVAYGDMIAKEYETLDTVNTNKDQDEELKFLKEYATEIEKPLFKDVDDMLLRMGSMMGFNPPKPTHDNEES